MKKQFIAVIGTGTTDTQLTEIAFEVGRLIAGNSWILVCGGLGGVMESSAMGAKEAGGTTVGILPQNDRHAANRYIDIPIATGFGEGRNVIIVRCADLLIAVGGEYGTLSEIALALKMGKPVIGIGSWNIKGVVPAATPSEALAKAREILVD